MKIIEMRTEFMTIDVLDEHITACENLLLRDIVGKQGKRNLKKRIRELKYERVIIK